MHYRDEQAVTYAEPFDDLALATGASAVVPGWAVGSGGSLIPGVRPVKNLDDGTA